VSNSESEGLTTGSGESYTECSDREHPTPSPLPRPTSDELRLPPLTASEGTNDSMTSPAIEDWLRQVADEARANAPSSDLEEFVAANAVAIEADNMQATIALTRRICEKLTQDHLRAPQSDSTNPYLD